MPESTRDDTAWGLITLAQLAIIGAALAVVFPPFLEAIRLAPAAAAVSSLGWGRLLLLIPIAALAVRLARGAPADPSFLAWREWGATHGAEPAEDSEPRPGEGFIIEGYAGLLFGHPYRLEVLSRLPERHTCTRLRVAFEPRTSFQFAVRPQNALSGIVESRWMQDKLRGNLRVAARTRGMREDVADWFVTGDVAGIPGGFDATRTVKSTDPDQARALFGRREMLHRILQLDAAVSWSSWTLFHTDAAGTTAELTLEFRGRAQEVAQLEALWAAQVAAIEALADLGIIAGQRGSS